MDLDDLRNLDDDSSSGRMSFDDIAADDDFEGMAIDDGSGTATASSGPFLGMSAQERMFLSIMLFGNVLVLGIAILLATGRIG